MKKQILLIAAALLLGMTACQKENINVIDNNQAESTMVKSTADLIGTEWTFTMNLLDSVEFDFGGCGLDSIPGLNLEIQLGLNFDSTYAHITFPEDAIVLSLGQIDGEYTMEEIESMNFAYVYDPTTLTGSLTANTFNDNGDPATYQIPFTYDPATDAIIIEMNIEYYFDEDDVTTIQIVFHRNTL